METLKKKKILLCSKCMKCCFHYCLQCQIMVARKYFGGWVTGVGGRRGGLAEPSCAACLAREPHSWCVEGGISSQPLSCGIQPCSCSAFTPAPLYWLLGGAFNREEWDDWQPPISNPTSSTHT